MSFLLKLKRDDIIDKYIACLVANGYKVKNNIDYFYTYSPVTRIASNRMLFVIAFIYKLIIHQVNVKNYVSK